ncbi:MAG: family 16 glycoside hydrolase [Isosphaeraceae bacterium]
MSALRSRLALTVASAGLCLAFGLGLAAPSAATPADEPAFVPIFNGKDLTGWDGEPEHWSVKDGAITGVTSKEHPLKYNKFLIWRGGKPKNFELKVSFRLMGNNNSGVQYRSKEMTKVGPYSVGGYQADIHPNPPYCGMLYDERGRGIVAEAGQKVVITPAGKKQVVGETDPVKPSKLDDWNDLVIIARGNHLVHKLNGRTTVDVLDHQEAERELEGLIALQIHQGPAMTAQFRSIELKTLPDGGIIPPGEAKAKAKGKGQTKEAAKKKRQPPAMGPAPEATKLTRLKTLKGFKVELVHTVPRETEGSWVSMTVDPKGRLIVCDQYGKLYRVTPSKLGGPASETKVEPIDLPIGGAHGLLWAFDSLYLMNNEGQGGPRGLYRILDTNNDDKLDKVEFLRQVEGNGEHGPHSIVLSPDGKSLYIVAGNATALPKVDSSLVPRIWGEDNMIPHMPDGAGFMTTEKAPGGWVCKVDPDGKNWELVSMGYRNPFDIAFNRAGELFTYDSDMEWDMNLPWYRPTRVCQVVSGSDFGYRNGSGKWPAYYLDSLPPVVDVGPGSPTGITFGYGAKFPAKYQEALFICDWSYGKLYAVHLKDAGAESKGELEEFVTGSPLALTDMLVRPQDGALYFAIGGRRTSSALFRVVYAGDEPHDVLPDRAPELSDVLKLRHKLESFHGHADAKAVDAAWPYLGHPDRFVRFAARVAVEWQDPSTWRDRALNETDPAKAVPALLALTRVSATDPAHRTDKTPPADTALRDQILKALDRASEGAKSTAAKLDVLRTYEVVLNRFGKPEGAAAEALGSRFARAIPAASQPLNRELAELAVALGAPEAAEKVVGLLAKAPTQEEQIDYAKDLRVLQNGWTPELRKTYLTWVGKSAAFKGGNSIRGFMRTIRNDSEAKLSEAEKTEFKSLLEPPANAETAAASLPSRPHVKNWTLEELVPLVDKGLHGRDYDRGRALFGAAACFTCHRFANEGGGAGPELTGLAGRFSARDLLESIVQPSKVISDQYGAVIIATTDGKVVTGRIVNLHNDVMSVVTNMLDPNNQTSIDRNKIEDMKPSPTSMMPEGLLNTLKEDEVLDLMAYLLSRGDRESEVFKKP